MKAKSSRKSRTSLIIKQIPLIVVLLIFVLLWRYESHKSQKNLDKMFDKIVSIESAKTSFIQKYRDVVMGINPELNSFECIMVLSCVYDNGRRFGLDPELVLAIIENESEFDRKALSPVGAKGLMQVMPGTGKLVARYVGMLEYDLYEIPDNIAIGCCYLMVLLEYHNERIALAIYNAGGNYEYGIDYANDVLADKEKWL